MRKLANAAISFSIAIFLSVYIFPAELLPLAAILLAAAGLLLIKFKIKWLRMTAVSLISLSLGFCCFFTKYLLYVFPAEQLNGKTELISGRLLDYPYEGDNYTRFHISMERDGRPDIKLRVYSHGQKVDCQPGDILTFSAKLSPTNMKYGKNYRGLTAKGIFLKGNAVSEIKHEPGSFCWKTELVKLSRKMSELSDEIFPADIAPFMKSLLLGDRADLNSSDSLSLSMSRAGLMHVVAISGMHISYLVGLIKLIMGNSKRSSLMCIAVTWFFVLLTGAAPSAVRAGIMQTIMLMAPVFERENDPVTSLSAALSLILLKNPYAAANIGLQLSFAAMAGIYCFASKIFDYFHDIIKKKGYNKLLYGPAASAASSLSVMVFTVPLTALHFGYVALYSVFSTLLSFWAVSLCFCGGAICCLAAIIFRPAGAVLAWLVAWPARYIVFIAGFISKLPLSAVYMNSPYGIAWLIFTYTVFAFAVKYGLKGWKLVLPVIISLACLVSAYLETKADYTNCPGVITALDTGQGECICVISGENTLLYDCGGMASLKNAGDSAGEYLRGRGRNSVETLVLSHLDKDHVNGVCRLMEQCSVKTIIIPLLDYENDTYYNEISESAEAHGTELIAIGDSTEMSLDNIHVMLYPQPDNGKRNDSGIIMLISVFDYDMLACGDASGKVEKNFIKSCELPEMELLIVSHHGSKYSSSTEFLSCVDGETAIICCGWNSYGHPSEETLERLDDCGYNVLRTDLDSTVEIWIGREYGQKVR